jgi:uncharacterized protein (DUF2267 family)
MEYEEIVAVVRQASGGIGSEAADRALQATLQTLAERLSRGEARHIVPELPAELKPWIYTETDAEAFDIDEFLVKVAKREETDVETALRHARAVFFALGDALSAEAVAHLAASLPQTFDPLVAEAQRRDLDIMPADQFWARVRQRLGVDDTTARLATDAVLEILAERMPLEEFLRRVAAREGADVDEADLYEEITEHARAVFATLAEAVSIKEWFDVIVELPEEYHGLFPPRLA